MSKTTKVNIIAVVFLIIGLIVSSFLNVYTHNSNTAVAAVMDARNIHQETITLNDATELTDAFNLEDKCLVGLWVGTVVTTDITAQCATTEAGTYNTLADSTGTTVTLVTGLASNDAIDLTIKGKQLCGFVWCKLKAETDQTTDRTDWVILKAR